MSIFLPEMGMRVTESFKEGRYFLPEIGMRVASAGKTWRAEKPGFLQLQGKE